MDNNAVGKILPSTAVQILDQLLSDHRIVSPGTASHRPPSIDVDDSLAAVLSGVLELVQAVPDELLQVEATQRLHFYAGIQDIRRVVGQREQQTELATYSQGLPKLRPLIGQSYGLELIRNVLKECPDEVVREGTRELPFISDVSFRESLRSDLSAVNSALESGEYKAATVLGGSAIEALLLWALQQTSQQVPSDILCWDLHRFIEAALRSALIQKHTALIAGVAKDYRNLIHPGRAQRLKQQCDRATALAVVSAIEHVVTDLSAKFSPTA